MTATANPFDESGFTMTLQDMTDRTEPRFQIVRTLPRPDGTGSRRRVVLQNGRGRPKACFHGKPLEAAAGAGEIRCRACEWEAERLDADELEGRWPE